MSDKVVDLATVSDEGLADLLEGAGLTLRNPTRFGMIDALVGFGIARWEAVDPDAYDPSLLTAQERRTIDRANGVEVPAAGGHVYREGAGPTGAATVTHEGGRPNAGQPQRVWRGA